MKAKLTIEGREIEIELTTEQVDQILSKKEVKSWNDLGIIEGWYVNSASSIALVSRPGLTERSNKNVFATENQAKGFLAAAQLSQLMKHVGGGWRNGQTNHCIERWGNEFRTNNYINPAQFLAFPTADIRDKFLANHSDLIEEYFLIYQ